LFDVRSAVLAKTLSWRNPGNAISKLAQALVEFRWDKTNPQAPTWQQSFSGDNGNTWEVNWYMYFSGMAAENSAN
jgi:hypothetical protein